MRIEKLFLPLVFFSCAPSNKEIVDVSNKIDSIDNPQSEFYECILVEEMPQFPGGYLALREYLQKNVIYPETAREKGIQGRVILTFVVECDGTLTNIKVVRSVDPALDKEAIRVIQNMPKWIPGKQSGEIVPYKYSFPVDFKL